MRQFNTLTGFLTSKSANPSTSDTVEFLGYAAIGDGGGAKWKHNGVTGQTASRSPEQLGRARLNDASGNQWGLIPTTSNSGAEINPKHLGAVGNSTSHDDTLAIKAAYGECEFGDSNQVVRFPVGVFTYDGVSQITITKATSTAGAGAGATRINFTGTANNFIRFQGGREWTVEDISFRNEQACTSGVVIDIYGTLASQDALINRVDWRGGSAIFDFIQIGGGAQKVFIENMIVAGQFNSVIKLSNAFNNYLRSFIIDGNDVGTGIILDGTAPGIEVFHMSDGIIANCGKGLTTTGDAAVRFQGVAGLKCDRVWFDDAKIGEGVTLDKAILSSFVECHFVSCEGQAGCWVKDSVGTTFTQCHFDKNVSHGLRIDAEAIDTTVIGGTAIDNDDLSAGGKSGIWIEGGAEHFIISGVTAGQTSIYNKPQDYGITLGSNCDNFIIENNNLTRNVIEGLQNPADVFDDTHIVRNNIGAADGNAQVKAYGSFNASGGSISENSSVNCSIVYTGVGTYTITLDKAMADALYSVECTPTATDRSIFVGSKTTTTFIINHETYAAAATNSGSNLQFSVIGKTTA